MHPHAMACKDISNTVLKVGGWGNSVHIACIYNKPIFEHMNPYFHVYIQARFYSSFILI